MQQNIYRNKHFIHCYTDKGLKATIVNFFKIIHSEKCRAAEFLLEFYIEQSPNLMNLSHVSNPPKKPVLIERRLKSRNIGYNFKWNQPYFNRV